MKKNKSNNLKSAVAALKKRSQPTYTVYFGKQDSPQDKYYQELLRKAYKGELMCYQAFVKMKAIKPFTNYKPVVSQGLKQYFIERLTKKDAMPLYVYQKGGEFVMSDEYSLYSFYKEIGIEVVPCIVVGKIFDTKDVIKVGEPFCLKDIKNEFLIEE